MLRVNWSCEATRCLFLQPLDSNYLCKFMKVMRVQRKCAVCCRPMLFGWMIKLDAPPLVPIAEKAETPYEMVSVDLTGPSAALHGQVLLTMNDRLLQPLS